MGYSKVEAKEDVKACKTCAFFWHWSGETEYNFCLKWNDIIPSEEELNVCDRYIKEKHDEMQKL
jgi:hypothetical protein